MNIKSGHFMPPGSGYDGAGDSSSWANDPEKLEKARSGIAPHHAEWLKEPTVSVFNKEKSDITLAAGPAK